MQFVEIIWRQQFLDKIVIKHQVQAWEVEEALEGRPLVRRQQRGRRRGQDLYVVYGQTEAGRYLVVFVIRKPGRAAMPISARDMTKSERSFYEERR